MRTWIREVNQPRKNSKMCRLRSSPAIDHVPPSHLEPLLEGGLGPLTVLPPMRSEQALVVGRCHRPVILRQPVRKDGERPRGMPVAGNQQHALWMELLQAFCDVQGFCNRGVLFIRTHAYKRLHLMGICLKYACGVLRGRMAKVVRIRRRIEKQVFPIASAQ